MKLYKSIFAVLAVAATSGALVSCDDDLDRPPVIVPVATYEANTSIAEFKELLRNAAQNNTPETIPVNADGDSIILAGRVISSDRSGNVYQRIYVRDESGAMDFRIYGYDLNESYHMGGKCASTSPASSWAATEPDADRRPVHQPQHRIDKPWRHGQGRIHPPRTAPGLPAATDAEPYTVKISDLEATENDKEKLIQWQCQLVKIENVSFDGGGRRLGVTTPAGPDQPTALSRTLKAIQSPSAQATNQNSPHRSYPKAPDLLWLSSATTTAPAAHRHGPPVRLYRRI